MRVSRKRLRERVKDICDGSGLKWIEEDSYFYKFCMEDLGAAVSEMIRAFSLKDNCRLTDPRRWKSLGNLDEMVDLVAEAIEHDSEG